MTKEENEIYEAMAEALSDLVGYMRRYPVYYEKVMNDVNMKVYLQNADKAMTMYNQREMNKPNY